MDKESIYVPRFRTDGSECGYTYYKGKLFCKYCGTPNLYEFKGGDYYYPMNYYCPVCEKEWCE